MDSDEVDSINDTNESLSVAYIIKECYFDILGKLDLPEDNSIFQLTASGSSSLPCVMYLPSNVLDLNKVYYNALSTSNPTWSEMTYTPFDNFITMTSQLSTSDSFVSTQTITVGGQTFVFNYRNDVQPRFYTSFDDVTLLFDSYDHTQSSTLVGARTLCYGALEPTFTLSDTYVPDLDARQFQLLLQASKAQAFYELKQVENPKAEKKERSNIILAQRTKNAIDRRSGSQTYRGYGRR